MARFQNASADTYDAVFIAKTPLNPLDLVQSKVRDAIEATDLPQSLLIMSNGRINFSTGTNYHEISPKTFIEQLIWDETAGKLKPFVVYPDSLPGISSFKQQDFALPANYEPGSP
jgi:hypothetical protein